MILTSLLMLLYMGMQAQTVWHGQWYIVVAGLPQGDMQMIMTTDCNSQPPIASITDPTNPQQMIRMEEVRVTQDTFSAKFKGMGVTLPISMTLTDERNAEGRLMGRFPLKASKDKLFELSAAEDEDDKLKAKDTLMAHLRLDCRQRAGRYKHFERLNNIVGPKPSDPQLMNANGLHATIARVWAGIGFELAGISEASEMADYLLVSYDFNDLTRRQEMKDHLKAMKQKYPKLRYVEQGNEYDYNQSKHVSSEQYYSYYRAMYQAVNEVNSELQPAIPLECGGPASSTFNQMWLTRFLDDYAKDKCKDKRLDFISYHGYFVMADDGTRQFFKDNPSLVRGQREWVSQQLRQRGLKGNIPVFVTELGIYPGPLADDYNNMGVDQLRQAAGMMSLLWWYGREDGILPFNWVLRHPQEGRKDQLVCRDNDGNLIEAPGKMTPYGNAMKMMAMLGDEQLTVEGTDITGGKGLYAVATVGGNSTAGGGSPSPTNGLTILLWNYQGTGRHAFETELQINNLPKALQDRRVEMKTYLVDAQHCNYNHDPETCNLHPLTTRTMKPLKQLSRKLTLAPNALVLIELKAK